MLENLKNITDSPYAKIVIVVAAIATLVIFAVGALLQSVSAKEETMSISSIVKGAFYIALVECVLVFVYFQLP